MMFTSASDTLVADTAALNAWRQNPDFDYARELVQPDVSVWRWIEMYVARFFELLFDNRFYRDNGTAIWIGLGVAVVIAVAVFVIHKRPELFRRSEKPLAVDYAVTEDAIYGVDFVGEISSAMARKDYREAVRLVYLHTLRVLSDCGKIDWKPFKTPGQYTWEFPAADFKMLSNHFLRVRYGNFMAGEELVEEMLRLHAAIGHSVVEGKGGVE